MARDFIGATGPLAALRKTRLDGPHLPVLIRVHSRLIRRWVF